MQLVAGVGTTNPITGTLAIRDADRATGVTPPLGWTADGGTPWAQPSLSAGTAPNDVTISADPTGFTGVYTGTVSVNAGAATETALVQLEVVKRRPLKSSCRWWCGKVTV